MTQCTMCRKEIEPSSQYLTVVVHKGWSGTKLRPLQFRLLCRIRNIVWPDGDCRDLRTVEL